MKQSCLSEMLVKIFERDDKPYIQITLMNTEGEVINVVTELDVSEFRVRFTDDHTEDPTSN